MRYNGVWAHEIVHGMFSMASRGRGAPRTSRPTMGARVRVRTWHALADMARGVVGADVPGGPRARGRPRWRPVGVLWSRTDYKSLILRAGRP